RVLAQLASRPGINARQRGIPLRWIYPDAFFHFQDTGALSITLRAPDFRANETKPVLASIGILLVTDGSVSPANLNLSLATPTGSAVTAPTDTNGAIDSNAPNSPWAPLASGSA